MPNGRPASNGEAAAASGLRMRPRDLAKLGQLVLERGRWGEHQLVPAEWLDQSFAPHAHVEEGLDYGYQWWLGRLSENGQPWVAGFGNGGQRVIVVPGLHLVVVDHGRQLQPARPVGDLARRHAQVRDAGIERQVSTTHAGADEAALLPLARLFRFRIAGVDCAASTEQLRCSKPIARPGTSPTMANVRSWP